MSYKFFAALITVLVMAACAPASPTSTPPPATSALELDTTFTSSAPMLDTLDKKVDVGGYKLWIICTGQGTPTVVVEHGPGDPALETGHWTRVRYGVEKMARICLYDRAGLGSSEPPSTKPRTSQDMVNDLHTLLVNADVPGPYVLVGHDLGAFNVRLYASQYPDEVAGIVLVDPLHPDYESETLAVLPPESTDEPDAVSAMRLGLWPDTTSGEGIDAAASAEQIRETGSLGDLPLVVLTQRTRWFLIYPDTPPDVLAKMEEVWANLQADLAKLSTNSTHVIAIADGQTAADEEQQIVDAILKVVEQAKR